MKAVNRLEWRHAAWLAVCGMGLVLVTQAQVVPQKNYLPPDGEPIVKEPEERAEQTTAQPKAVQSANKGSLLIGSEVRNAEDIPLGKITDIVMDLPNGRISYVVLSTGGGLFGIGEKTVAVPPGAFSVAASGRSLILKVDKKKLEAAEGLTARNWPDVGSVAWGAQADSFWKVEGQTSPQLPPREREAREPSPESERTQNLPGDVEDQLAVETHRFEGEVIALDPRTGALAVRNEESNQTMRFVCSDQTKVLLKGQPEAKASDLKQGQRVVVSYRAQPGGRLIVDSIQANGELPK